MGQRFLPLQGLAPLWGILDPPMREMHKIGKICIPTYFQFPQIMLLDRFRGLYLKVPDFILRGKELVYFSYVGDDVSMYVFLPNDIEGLDDLEDKLEAESINEAIEDIYSTKVNVQMPKFEITQMLKLKDALSSLGKYRLKFS